MRLMDASRIASKSTNYLGDKMDGDTDGVMRRGVCVCAYESVRRGSVWCEKERLILVE